MQVAKSGWGIKLLALQLAQINPETWIESGKADSYEQVDVALVSQYMQEFADGTTVPAL